MLNGDFMLHSALAIGFMECISFFSKNTDTDSIMRHICGLLEIGSYCIVEGGTQTVIDTNGDVISFADFTEKYD